MIKILILTALLTTLFIPNALALTPECLPSGAPATPRADFLVTATSLIGKFGSAKQVCVVNEDRAAFVSYKIPSYADLKSIYYTQAKSSANVNKVEPYGDNPGLGSFQPAIFSSGKDSVFFVNGTLNINGTLLASPAVDKTAIVFIERDLNIESNIAYGGSNFGIVFVVGGNVVIGHSVTTVNAVIISSGTIFTAGNNCATSEIPATQLIINGSLISLNPLKQVQFCRTRTIGSIINNSLPAEKINHQSKYVVILRNIFSDTLQKWSEIP